MGDFDLDSQRLGDGDELSLALERQQRTRQRGGAENRRVGPGHPDAFERLAQDPPVERRVVGHHHPPAQARLQLSDRELKRWCVIDHRL